MRLDEAGYGPYVADRSVGPLNRRQVQDKWGNILSVSGQPHDYCDVLVSCKNKVLKNQKAFAQNFEIMAPIMNIAMWAPDSLDELWFEVNTPLTDCGLKTEPIMLGSDISEA